MESERSKSCFKCGEIKPLSAFYKHPAMSDGHVNKCKECNKVDVRVNRNKRIDYYNEYDKIRSEDKTSKRYSKSLEYGCAYRDQNPEKRKAVSLLRSRVRSGKVSSSSVCECCGSDKNINGHHSSYSEDMWLLVTWLCARCHHRLHKDFEFQLGPWSEAF
jgi:hypothetical protein